MDNDFSKQAINEVMTLEEAAELWGKSTDSLRQACIERQGRPPRFKVGIEARRSKRIWLVTRAGMERLYGPAPKDEGGQ